jgi:predicted transposase YdaD
MTREEMRYYAGLNYFPEVARKFKREGLREGLREGKLEGLREGRMEDRAEATVELLEERGIQVPDEIRRQILGCDDLKRLSSWFKRAITASTAAEVIAA